MDRIEVSKMLRGIQNVYSNFELSEDKIDIWTPFFKNTKMADVRKRFVEYVSANKYPPTISDLMTHRINNVPAAAAYRQEEDEE